MGCDPREKIGRNDPCPCGSGSKYKHCCLASQAAIDSVWQRQHEEAAGLVGEMMKFAGREFGELVLEAGKDLNMGELPKPLDDAGEECRLFMPYYLFQWDPERSPRSKKTYRRGLVASCYVGQESERFTELDWLFIEQATTQPISFYEVLRSRPGRGMAVRDIFTGEETEEMEPHAAQTAPPVDIIYAQIWHEPELTGLRTSAPECRSPKKKREGL